MVFQLDAFQHGAFQIELIFQLNAFQNDAFQIEWVFERLRSLLGVGR